MLSDSSDDDELLLPNGFDDVAADLVNVDFDRKDSCDSPPRKKKKRGKKDKSIQESFENNQELVSDSPFPSDTHQGDAVCILDDSNVGTEDVSYVLTDTISGNRRSKRIAKTSSTGAMPLFRSTRKSSYTAELTESDSVVISPEPSPPALDVFDITAQSSFSFDVEEDTSVHEPDADPNAEVEVRVLWKGIETLKFPIRKFQKIKEIYTFFAKRENVEESKIIFTLKDQLVNPHDTPAGLNIGVSSLEGGVTDVATSHASQSVDSHVQDPNAINLQIQRSGVKEKLTVSTLPHEKISVLILKLSEELNIPSSTIKLMFDGEELSPESTPIECDMEGGECVDLITRP